MLDNECEYHNEAAAVVAIVEKMNCDEFVDLFTTKNHAVRVFKRLVDLAPDFRLGVEVLRALEKIMLGAREEHFERLRANVEVESFRCIVEMLDPRFAFEFGEKLTAKVMDISWPEEVDSHYLDYAKLGVDIISIGALTHSSRDCTSIQRMFLMVSSNTTLYVITQ